MKAAIFYGGRDIRVEEVADPVPGPGEVLVDIGAAGICGSDLHPYRGANPWGSTAAGAKRGGHELAGVVAAIGSGVTKVRIGQRVGVEPLHLVGCGACRACLRGDYHICPRRGVRNGVRQMSAGFSEFDLVVEGNVYPLPDQVSLEAASMLDVFTCGVHAVHRVPIAPHDSVCVIGTGPIGMAMGQVAKASGARQVIMVGRRDELLQRALGARAADRVINNQSVNVGEAVAELTDGWGCDVVYETVGGGTSETLAQSVEAAAPGAAIGVIGAFWGDVSVGYRAANNKEIDLRWCNSYGIWNGVREYQIALDMLAAGRLNAEPLVTHRFSLDDIGAAFQAADDKKASGAIKVIVQP